MHGTQQRTRPALVVSVAILLAATLAACGGGGKATQVVVKVNKDEITVSQVNDQLARLGAGVPADQAEAAKRKILSSLVNQQLLVQQAIERKLDRDPQIIAALDGARANILAQAYVQKVIAPQAKPGEQEVRQYYTDNPALFAERKVYRLQELTIEANADQAKAIETAAAGAKSLKQLADFLRERKIPFGADSGVRTAEQLPLTKLAQIAQLKPGNVLVFEAGPERLTALEVLASEAQPVDEKKAAPVIEQYLGNRKREELATSELKRLRDQAKIEYIGDFAKYAADAPASASASAAAPAPAPAQPAASDQGKGIAALH